MAALEKSETSKYDGPSTKSDLTMANNISLQSQASASHPLTKRLNKILDNRLDGDNDMLEVLSAVSLFFPENSLRARRNLRSDIERRSVAINQEFASAFSKVNELLADLSSSVSEMSTTVQDMSARLAATKEQTRDLIRQTTQLQSESKNIQMKQQVVNTFLEKYTLKPEEIKVLRGGPDGSLQPAFFAALQRVREIHNDCKLLLRTKQQTAGLEIMEAMALQQEAAYERLYRWAQGEVRLLLGDAPDIPPMLTSALAALHERPVLYSYTKDEYSAARRAATVRAFLDALTRGGPGGTPRPMELSSHDPLRYVGDMLAWLHQTTAGEADLLNALLRGTQDGGGSHAASLSHITEGVCRPFKVRVEQVIASEPGVVVLFKLTNLIKFYHHTLGQVLQKDAGLLATIDEARDLSNTMFFSSLASHTAKLLDKAEVPGPNLSPPPALSQTLALLQDIFSSHDSSLVPFHDRQQDFSKILSNVVDPLVQMCSMSASRLSTCDMAVYMVNCITTIHQVLAIYGEYTEARLEMLTAQVEAHLDAVTNEAASYVLQHTGLATLYQEVQRAAGPPLASRRDLDQESVRYAMGQFDLYLGNTDSYQLPQAGLLLSATKREKVVRAATELVYSAYEQMYSAVHSADTATGYSHPETLMPRTPAQVRHLLGL